MSTEIVLMILIRDVSFVSTAVFLQIYNLSLLLLFLSTLIQNKCCKFSYLIVYHKYRGSYLSYIRRRGMSIGIAIVLV